MNERLLYYIWLSSSLYPGSSTAKLLLNHFDSIYDIYNAAQEQLLALSVSEGELSALSNKNLDNAKRYYEYCRENKVGILCYDDPYYPERLKIIDNPPPMLYFLGKLYQLDDYPCITMVGTRSCSERGFRLAYEAGFESASKGAVIVNGLALGIDGACIAGALDAGGYAVGVLGCGIDKIYPYGNKDLFERLSATGLILTEFAPFTEPRGNNFPIRNRVMSALSLATVVFEAALSSGAMHTAKHALSQGRRIFAVPGKPYDKSYSGPLSLIKDGASVFTEANDVLSEYSMSFPHRINLANEFALHADKLDGYVARYFKKDTPPDEPVNRRFLRQGKKNAAQNTQNAEFTPQPQQPQQPQQSNHAKKSVQSSTKSPSAHAPGKTDSAKTAAGNTHSVQASSSGFDISILSHSEREVYTALVSYGSMTADEICDSGIKIDDVLSALTLLEIYGLIKAKPGGKYEII